MMLYSIAVAADLSFRNALSILVISLSSLARRAVIVLLPQPRKLGSGLVSDPFLTEKPRQRVRDRRGLLTRGCNRHWGLRGNP